MQSYQVQSIESIKHNCQLVKYTDNYYRVTFFSRSVFTENNFDRVGEVSDRVLPVCYDLNNPCGSSVNRAKNKIFEIATQNNWLYMVTLTLDPSCIDRFDKKYVQKKVSKWLYNNAYRKNLKFLIVPELHVDGAVHFHGLFSDSGLNLIDSGFVKVKGLKGGVLKDKAFGDIQGAIFNISDFPFGYTSAVMTDNNTLAICRYITKYCVKDLSKIFGSFYLSGGPGLVRSAPRFLYDVGYNEISVPDRARVIDLNDNLGQCIIFEGTKADIQSVFSGLNIRRSDGSTEQNKCFIP